MRRPWAVGLAGTALAGAAALLWLGAADGTAATGLRPPPVIPALTAGELARLDDDALLGRISAEGTRRLLAAGRGWGAGQEVLPPALRHLWTVTALEPDVAQTGFAHVIALAAGERPALPPLADLAAAYRAFGQPVLADLVDAAQESPDPAAAGHDQRFRAALPAGRIAARAAWARAHAGELVASEATAGPAAP